MLETEYLQPAVACLKTMIYQTRKEFVHICFNQFACKLKKSYKIVIYFSSIANI